MKSFTALFYRASGGSSPVKEFIDKLSPDAQRKLFEKIGWLEELGPRLTKPHAEKIGKYIYELKVYRDDAIVRLFYFFFEQDKIIFVNGFKKKTNKTPPRQIRLAEQRRKDFLIKEGKG